MGWLGKNMSKGAPKDNNEVMVEKHCSRYLQNNYLKPPAKVITIIILEITICCWNLSFQEQSNYFLFKDSQCKSQQSRKEFYMVTNVLQDACDLVGNDWKLLLTSWSCHFSGIHKLSLLLNLS